jgi:hypothetical protein
MILARNFEGFGLLSANVFLGAFNAGMPEQQLGRAQVAGLLINMSWECECTSKCGAVEFWV